MLKINFKITEPLMAEFKHFGEPDAADAVVVTIDNEEMMMMTNGCIATHGDVDEASRQARQCLQAAQAECAYVLVCCAPAEAALVIYVSDNAKAKERMLYAAGSAHVEETLTGLHVRTIQTSSIESIEPRLFSHKQTDEGREALMTESERMRAEIDKMEVAPQPTALPGITSTISADCIAAIKKVVAHSLLAVTVMVEGSLIMLDKEIAVKGNGDSTDLRAITELLPRDHPRYCVFVYNDNVMLVHVCPVACRAKEKMPYALSKASFINQLSAQGIKVAYRREVSDADEFISTVEEVGNGVEVDHHEKHATPPHPAMCKGPRMLI